MQPPVEDQRLQPLALVEVTLLISVCLLHQLQQRWRANLWPGFRMVESYFLLLG